ncbi:MAG: hypothetical protein GVY14_10200 [Spirochaetes bacterium]|nr:hypothetical protein [Spirochaetota bacterium]
MFLLPVVFGALSLAHQPVDGTDVSGPSAMRSGRQAPTAALPEDVLEFDGLSFYNYYTVMREQPE